MNVLDSFLQLFGLAKASPPVPGTQDLSVWVPLALTVDGYTAVPPAATNFVTKSTTHDLAKLGAKINFTATVGGTAFTVDMLTALTTKGLLRPDPADATQFQVNLTLRIYYPSTTATPGVINAKSALPVALLNHGNHDSWKPSGAITQTGPTTLLPSDIEVHPSYQGYTYLQKALAVNNVVTVSVDHNFACFTDSLVETRADTIIAALDALSTEAAKPASRYFNLLDFTKIGLMGHSRGGDGVVRAAQKIAADPALNGKYLVNTVCSLAPTDFTGTDLAHRLVLGATDLRFYLVLYGALDGDVSGVRGALDPVGTGFRHYDRAQCPKSMVFLDKCCHDRFNTLWSAEPAEAGLGDARLVNDAAHQSIAIDYLGDLFQWQLAGADLPKRFDGRSPNRADVHASLQWLFGTTVKQLENFEDAANNLLGAPRALKNPGVPTTIDDMASITIAGAPLALHTGHQTHVLHVDLSAATAGTTAVLEEPVPPAHKDWSALDTLIFSLSGWFDPTSVATIQAAKLPRLKVTLRDGTGGGHSASIDSTVYGTTLPSRPVFKNLPGNGDNLTLMRLETIPVALTAFTGVDLGNLVALDLDIQADNGTHVFVDNIHVVKR